MSLLKEYYDLIVAGGGASGIIASIIAAERGKTVLLLEKADHPGRKIQASGNGRCNLMNTGNLRYYGDSQFASEVLSRYSAKRLTDFFQHIGLLMTDEADGRRYPLSCQSASVMNVLKNALKLYQIELKNNTAVKNVCQTDNGFSVYSADGDSFHSRKLLIACGGAAQPKLGGTDDGYHLLESFGHRIVPVSPALVPLITDKRSISGLTGIRIKCRVSLYHKSDLLHREEGEVLFTDYGVSGICIMQCARFTGVQQSYIELDFLNHIFSNSDEIKKELIRRQSMYSRFSPVTILEGILNSKLAYAVMKQAQIALRGETAGDLTEDDLCRIIYAATHYRIDIYGTKGFDSAQVTAGGADCSEFNPATMESKIIPGLYAAGEVLNVDGDCGGFNLMFAFSSGMAAGYAV